MIFDQAFYSAPHRLIGQRLWVRGAETTVTIYLEHGVVAVHPRGPAFCPPKHYRFGMRDGGSPVSGWMNR